MDAERLRVSGPGWVAHSAARLLPQKGVRPPHRGRPPHARSLFAVGSHTKKRPNNLVLGRLYDFRLYDMVEFGVHNYRSIQSFGGAAESQLGNKVGDVA